MPGNVTMETIINVLEGISFHGEQPGTVGLLFPWKAILFFPPVFHDLRDTIATHCFPYDCTMISQIMIYM